MILKAINETVKVNLQTTLTVTKIPNNTQQSSGQMHMLFWSTQAFSSKSYKSLPLHMTGDLSPPSICSMSLKIQNISQG